MKEVLIATNNAHKVEEIRTALNFEGWTFTTLAEAGVTSEPAEDADSFEGNARVKARAARAAARESLGRFVARGTIEGSIGREPRGSEGFGYDPLFLPDEYDGTRALAEVSQAEKNGISHRGNALRVLKKALSQSVDER